MAQPDILTNLHTSFTLLIFSSIDGLKTGYWSISDIEYASQQEVFHMSNGLYLYLQNIPAKCHAHIQPSEKGDTPSRKLSQPGSPVIISASMVITKYDHIRIFPFLTLHFAKYSTRNANLLRQCHNSLGNCLSIYVSFEPIRILHRQIF